MKKHLAIAFLLASLAAVNSSLAGDAPSIERRIGKAKKHLFLLSGQSNMFLMSSEPFVSAVNKAFGDGNVTVVKSAKRGAPIRMWDKEYKWPKDWEIPQGRRRPGRKLTTRDEFEAKFGELYDGLMASVKRHTTGKTYDTVTFVWMQGESDSEKKVSHLYPDSFDRIVARLKADLEIDSINIVIGRLSDYGVGKEGWDNMRKWQVKYVARPDLGEVEIERFQTGGHAQRLERVPREGRGRGDDLRLRDS